jgi:hypothetical protein
MDWATFDHKPARRDTAPALALVSVFWRMLAPSKKVLSCELYRAPGGRFEVRCSYPGDELARSQVVRSIEAGQVIADIWKMAVLEKGGFVEVDEA